ncbi:hypothetical protein HPB47_006936 [Ixodes persulcatus]|uniref:Uncharacterized protein n=1 Tax=Ixodes persulcatus TaxID=34615 RepID=A0AC60P8R8_IXOPE|nr:hypothetical protein HPB47_006936 [Ixodes persulcatus]
MDVNGGCASTADGPWKALVAAAWLPVGVGKLSPRVLEDPGPGLLLSFREIYDGQLGVLAGAYNRGFLFVPCLKDLRIGERSSSWGSALPLLMVPAMVVHTVSQGRRRRDRTRASSTGSRAFLDATRCRLLPASPPFVPAAITRTGKANNPSLQPSSRSLHPLLPYVQALGGRRSRAGRGGHQVIVCLFEKLQAVIKRHYPGWARVYTDRSVRPSNGSSTAAVFVERADLGADERLAFHATSTTTELAAILLALRLVRYKSRRPDSWLLLSDSQGGPVSASVPSHCGIPGNERADALAERVHDAAEFRTSDMGPFADAKLLIAREAAANHPDERYAAGDRQAKPPRGTGRSAAAVVHRIRTGCALTPARMHLLRNEADPECPTCGEWSDLDHLLLACPEHADARAAMTTSLAALGLPCNTTEEILRPRGDRRGKDRALRALLTFLEETGLLWSL